MAIDKLVDSAELDNGLGAIATAIRAKGGTAGSMEFPDGFINAIEALPAGTANFGTKTATLSGMSNTLTFTGLNGNPTNWMLVATANAKASSSNTTAICTAWNANGNSGAGYVAYSTGGYAKSTAAITKTYSAGTLTLNCSSVKFANSTFLLLYTY